jgi:hypothetical protein
MNSISKPINPAGLDTLYYYGLVPPYLTPTDENSIFLSISISPCELGNPHLLHLVCLKQHACLLVQICTHQAVSHPGAEKCPTMMPGG